MTKSLIIDLAKKLTLYMNSTRQDPPPEWDSLLDAVKSAYIEQATVAYMHIADSLNQAHADTVRALIDRLRQRDDDYNNIIMKIQAAIHG